MARKAIVLAAGMGTRLRPLTCTVPKPLMPAWSVPMLGRVVELLRGWGADDIAVNCHYLHKQIEEWCAANGCRAVYEPEILGTGGVLNPLRDWIGGDDFFLVNGDVVFGGVDSNPFAGVRDAPVPGVETIGLCLATEEGPRTIEADPDGVVTCWKSPDPGFPGTYTYCGAALLKAKILDYVAPSGFSTIVEAYEKAMADGLFVRAVVPDGMLWTDAGTVDSYIAVNEAGGENAFADIPHIRAAAAALPASASFDETKIRFLGARGSDRCFFDLGGVGVAVVYDDSKRGENARYAGHAKWLKERGAPVPDVLADIPEMKTTVFANAGAEKRMDLSEYTRVVEALADFNALDASALALEPPFDAALWKWERDLFAEHCLKGRFGVEECPKDAAAELEKIAALLDAEPRALVHRDFQPTNILWKDGKLSFIDFQGMRIGPAVYDLASLLYNPYAPIPELERQHLAGVYAKRCGRPGIVKILPYAAVQRLVQCLGAYGRLKSVGQGGFAKYVMPALELLLAAADEANLDAVGALAEDLIAKESAAHPHHHHDCNCDHHHHHHGAEAAR